MRRKVFLQKCGTLYTSTRRIEGVTLMKAFNKTSDEDEGAFFANV